jgi:hypothetical protein
LIASNPASPAINALGLEDQLNFTERCTEPIAPAASLKLRFDDQRLIANITSTMDNRFGRNMCAYFARVVSIKIEAEYVE